MSNVSTSLFRGSKKKLKIHLNNIQLQQTIAKGGGSGATIWQCDVDGWQCVCKELNFDINVDPIEIEAFESEIALVESLPFHKNIVKYLYHDRTTTKLRLFMTRYSCNLKTVIDDRKAKNQFFSTVEIAMHSLDIIRGLEYLHKNSILHRDLKSDNIFVILNDRKGISNLAIGDFDSAKKISKKIEAKTVIGTATFMAPEVWSSKNSKQYNFQADIFSFGMILFELITLERPYEEYSTLTIPDMIIKGVPPAVPPTIASNLQLTELLDIHKKCIALKPEDRPSTNQLKELFIHMIPNTCE